MIDDDVSYAAALHVAINDLHRLRRLRQPITPADVQLVIYQVKEAVRASTDETITLTMDVAHAQLFIEFLHDFDHDMPPRPICKVLGPLVGDIMMNEKLNRLDDIADKLGPMMILLSGLITERRPR